jgi:ferredoxin-NADP reductase
MSRAQHRHRRIGGIDVAASLIARVAPRLLHPAIERLRLDARSLLDDLIGVREPSFSTRAEPPARPRPLRDIDPVLELLPRPFKRPYSTLRRDLESIARDLRGERPRPTVRRPERSAPRSIPPPTFAPRRVRAVEIVRETADAVTIVLEADDGAPIAFEAGQFLTLHVAIDGRTWKRAYSISTSPLDGRCAITCKRVRGGKVSTFLVEALEEGAALEILGPSGSFAAPPATPEGGRPLFLVAGGSGITPCWSILRTVLATDRDREVTLVYGNRSEEDVIFGAGIDALAAREPRFRVVHVLSEPRRAEAIPGILDRATIGALPLDPDGDYLVCGPAAMMDAARDALLSCGVPPSRIREERFQSLGENGAALAAMAPQLVTLVRRGAERAITVPAGRTILEAAIANGVELPFSCAIGGCAACKCRVVDGTVALEEPSCLTPEERAAGWTLTCVGRPLAPTKLEVPT